MKKVWLFSRMSTFTGNENLKNLMDKCREEAFKKGYTVVRVMRYCAKHM